MASIAPSRFNDYRAESDTPLSADVWNSVFADISKRMSAVEAKGTGYDELVNAGIGVALARINDALAPQTQQLAALLVQANAYLDQIKANTVGAAIVTTDTTHRFVTDAQLNAIGQVAALAQAVATLQSKPVNEGRSFYFSTM